MFNMLYDIILPEPSMSFLASCDLWPCHLMWPVMWQHDLCHLTLTLVLKVENRSKIKTKWKREIKIKSTFSDLDIINKEWEKNSQDLLSKINYKFVNAKAFGLVTKNITKWLSKSLLGFQYLLNLLHPWRICLLDLMG